MSTKKQKKIFKPQPVLAPKLSLNQRWVRWRQQETKNRESAAHNDVKVLVLSSLLKDHQKTDKTKFNNDHKMKLHYQIWSLDKRAAISKTRNYCHYIGRSRSVNRKLYMARHTFRKFARFGMLPGLIKERD